MAKIQAQLGTSNQETEPTPPLHKYDAQLPCFKRLVTAYKTGGIPDEKR